MSTREVLKCGFQHNIWFYILSVVAIGLIIAAFIIPPTAVIDASVLGAVGEIFAFAALGTVIKAIDKGVDAKVEHNNTSLTVGNLGDKDEENL